MPSMHRWFQQLVASWQVLGVAAENGQQLKGKDPRETLSQAFGWVPAQLRHYAEHC